MSITSAGRASGARELDQQVAALDLFADRDVDARHRPVHRRDHGMLHLHRLENDEWLVRCHLLSGRGP